MSIQLTCLTWDDVNKLSDELARLIVKADFVPDVIVAVSRGGFVPARILCDLLDVRDLVSMSMSYYTDIGQRGPEPLVQHPLNANVAGRKVLLVDDVSDSGRTLQAALVHLRGKSPGDVKVATIHYKPWAVLKPDFFVVETRFWLVYPWELAESIRSLSRRFMSEGLGRAETSARLVSMGFRKRDVEPQLDRVG